LAEGWRGEVEVGRVVGDIHVGHRVTEVQRATGFLRSIHQHAVERPARHGEVAEAGGGAVGLVRGLAAGCGRRIGRMVMRMRMKKMMGIMRTKMMMMMSN
jgi:hypothetical protein